MAKHESAWKTMIHYYKDEHDAIHAPMVYGDVWVRTKSRQRMIFGLTATAQQALGDIIKIDYPQINAHFNAGETLMTITGTNMIKKLPTPFNITVQEVNSDLAENPAAMTDNVEKDNWLTKLKAD